MVLCTSIIAGCAGGQSDAAAAANPPGWAPDAAWRVVDLSHHFAPFGASGSLVVFDSAAGRTLVHDPERARTGYVPASTFKILNSLIALETGAVASEREVIPWDGVDRGDWWNGDMDMARAFTRSAVWFYQTLARRIGPEAMDAWVRAAGFGNADTGGGIDRFWLDGDLRVTAEEQVDFLRRLRAGALPFSERSMETVRRIMWLEDGDGWVMRGKTGWAPSGGRHYGWLVGWVETPGNVHVFALQVEGGADFPMRQARPEIVRGALRELGVIP